MTENASMGVSITRRGGLTCRCFRASTAGSLTTSHSLPAKPSDEDESDPQPVKRPDDAIAQFLQVLHEGHAQHAFLFLVFRIVDGGEEAEVVADAG